MAKINDIRVLAEETASDVASSPRDWMAYLDTAAKLYRYPLQIIFDPRTASTGYCLCGIGNME